MLRNKIKRIHIKDLVQEKSNLIYLKIKSRVNSRNMMGESNLIGLSIRYTDIMSLYVEYKDIFVNKIYHFNSEKKSPYILDGGGCIGMSVLYFKSIYPKAKIVCFEPDPEIFKILKQNLTTNNIDDVALINAGLAKDEGVLSFNSDNVDGGKIVENNQGNIKIRTVRLSEYITESVDFLKLNIEGQELPVIQEVEEFGKLRNIKEMVIEYHGWPNESQKLGELLTILDRNGFRYLIHDFDPETCGASKPPFHLNSQTTWFCLVYAQRQDVS
ncbi:FkbM family methyltransferase [Methanogenium sp. MK-MG]|uniref:FkbM family methyltransferase n=1 Tax=Methanogenium sp. MK-MG TaxID=2599926 RepID=UPI0013ED4E79|nr:FkbM family methyltransferase [Methanogenium sp. MK-MG]